MDTAVTFMERTQNKQANPVVSLMVTQTEPETGYRGGGNFISNRIVRGALTE